MDYKARFNAIERGFPGFDADFMVFSRWALKGVVRNLSSVQEAPTQEEWDSLRETMMGILDDIDETEEALA